MKNMKKLLMFFSLLLLLIGLSGCKSTGGESKMENNTMAQEREAALQIKGMFKDVAELEMREPYTNPLSSYTHVGATVTLTTGVTDNLNVTLGYTDRHGNGGYLEKGETDAPIKVFYSNGEEEILE